MALCLTGCFRFSSHVQSGHHTTRNVTQAVHPSPRTNQLYFTYRVEGENAILDSDKVTLVFTDIPASERRVFSFNGGAFPVQIGGEGISEGTVSCRRNFASAKFRARYQDGTTTIQFCDREVKLKDQARIVLVSDQTFDLSNGQKEVPVCASDKEG